MNAIVINRPNVRSSVLDDLARALPSIIADVTQVPGGKMAIVKPEQVSLQFTEASVRDVGSDIRIMVFARSNDPRTATENEMAKEILDKVLALVTMTGEAYSANIRLYLMEIGAAEYSPSLRGATFAP